MAWAPSRFPKTGLLEIDDLRLCSTSAKSLLPTRSCSSAFAKLGNTDSTNRGLDRWSSFFASSLMKSVSRFEFFWIEQEVFDLIWLMNQNRVQRPFQRKPS